MPTRLGIALRAASLLASATLTLGACSSCSSTSPGGSGSKDAGASAESGAGVSLTQACTDLAKAACRQIFSCTPSLGQIGYGDQATCIQRGTIACMPTVSAPGSTMTATMVDQCAQAVMGESCAQFLDNDQPSACNVPGTRPAGVPCGTDSQCQTGYCQLAPASVCGQCAARAQVGTPLKDGGVNCLIDADCMATLVCAPPGQCVSPGAMGATCSAQQPCLHTLACIGGKCATPVAVGGACTMLTDCDGAHGAFCNLATKTCTSAGTATTGQPCGIVNGGVVNCIGSSTCAAINAMGQGTCHQPAADNAPCGPEIACVAPATCTTTARCTLPDPSSCH